MNLSLLFLVFFGFSLSAKTSYHCQFDQWANKKFELLTLLLPQNPIIVQEQYDPEISSYWKLGKLLSSETLPQNQPIDLAIIHRDLSHVSSANCIYARNSENLLKDFTGFWLLA